MMHDQVHEIELPGCMPEPLMAYLKALGILRMVAEQRDTRARGRWQSDAFFLLSTLDSDGLMKFFLEEYRPTPIVASWAGGSGFFRKDNKKAVEAIAKSASPRLTDYRAVVHAVHKILAEEGVVDRPSGETKVRLLQRYRAQLPLYVVEWMDAAMVLQEDRQVFAPLLGTGGNDGRLDFTQNFMDRLVTLGITIGRPHDLSENWLRNALFAAPTDRLEDAAVGQFAPGRVGGPNATQGMEGNAADNPWDFVLMLEGTLLLAGAAARRLEAGGASRASFPFTVRPVPAGYTSSADKDEADSRGEIWLPLWNRPTTLGEIRTLFAEGRADVSGRRARDGLDFARAAATLGVDRGIKLFSRYSFLKRSGKAYLASPLGRFEVRERSEVDLLREIDRWLGDFRQAAGDKNAPPRFRTALRRIDQAIFELCRYGGRAYLQSVLTSLGRAERELGLTAGRIGQNRSPVPPLGGLSQEWITESDDDSVEFAIARALASLYDAEYKIGPLRANLEPVSPGRTTQGRFYANWITDEMDATKRHRAVVWSALGLAANLGAVLERRCMDGEREGCENLPLASPARVGLNAVAEFINAGLDDRKIEDHLWGLILIDNKGENEDAGRSGLERSLLPRSYALLKLLFLARPLAIERLANGEVRLRLTHGAEQGVRIKPEPAILHLIRAGRLGEACVVAMRRLRASGLNPLPRPIRGRRIRDEDWLELNRTDPIAIDPLRLAASLVIPVSERAVTRLGAMITNPEVAGDLVASEDTLSATAKGADRNAH